MISLLAGLSYVVLETPDVEKSVKFYEEKVGLTVTDRKDGKVYLRCWGDFYRYSVVITEGPLPKLNTMAWRTTSEEALGESVRRIEAAGITGTWSEGFTTGRTYTFVGPQGHPMALHWDVEHYEAPESEASTYPDRPSRRSKQLGAPRQLDHITVAARDVEAFVEWYRDVLGFRIMAYQMLPKAGITLFSVLTTNEKSHDLGVVRDTSDIPGRLNHYAFWVDTREDLFQTADILLENNIPIEYGPSIHGIGEQNFLYFREPSTLRIEVNTGGYRNYVPDWKPRRWIPTQGANNFYRNDTMPLSMTESFPPDSKPTATEEGIPAEILEQITNSAAPIKKMGH